MSSYQSAKRYYEFIAIFKTLLWVHNNLENVTMSSHQYPKRYYEFISILKNNFSSYEKV